MRVLYKISKVPFGHLGSLGHNSVVCVDDSFSSENCIKLVFIIFQTPLIYCGNWASVLTPSQTIDLLGFTILLKNMLSLTDEKKNKMKMILTDCLCK